MGDTLDPASLRQPGLEPSPPQPITTQQHHLKRVSSLLQWQKIMQWRWQWRWQWRRHPDEYFMSFAPKEAGYYHEAGLYFCSLAAAAAAVR